MSKSKKAVVNDTLNTNEVVITNMTATADINAIANTNTSLQDKNNVSVLTNNDDSNTNLTNKGIQKMKRPVINKRKSVYLPEGSMFTFNNEAVVYFSDDHWSITVKQMKNASPVTFNFSTEENYLSAVSDMQQMFNDTDYLLCPNALVAYSAIKAITLIPNQCIVVANNDIKNGLVCISVHELSAEEQAKQLHELCTRFLTNSKFAYFDGIGMIDKSLVSNVVTRSNGALVLNQLNQAVLWIPYSPEEREAILDDIYQKLGLSSRVFVEDDK